MKLRPNQLLIFLILIGIIIVGVAASLSIYAGINSYYDDSYYVYYGYLLLHNSYNLISTPGPATAGFLKGIPISISYIALGMNSTTAVLPSIIEYIGLILLIYLIGKHIAGDWTGLAAAFMFSISPFVIAYSTRVLPDLFVGLIAAVGLYLFYKAPKFGRNSGLAYAVAGFIVGMTVYIKVQALAFIVAMAFLAMMYVAFDRRKAELVLMAFFIFGIFMAFFIDAIIAFDSTGNPLYVITSSTHPNEASLTTNVYGALLLLDPWAFGIYSHISISSYIYPIGIPLLIFLAGACLGIAKGNRDARHISALGLIIFVYMIFGSASVKSYQFIPINDRYLILEAAAMFVAAAYFLHAVYQLAERHWNKIAGRIAILSVFAIMIILNIPIYSMLGAYNGGIRATDIRYQHLAGQILGYHQQNPGNLSVIVIGRYPRSQGRYLGLLLGYNKSVYIGPPYGVSCGRAYNGDLLLYLYSFYSQSYYNNQTAGWLGNNCSATLIAGYNMPLNGTGYNDFHYGVNNYGVIYRIEAH